MSYAQTFRDAHTARRERMGYPCAPKTPIVDLGAILARQKPIEVDMMPPPPPVDPVTLFRGWTAIDFPVVPSRLSRGRVILQRIAGKHGFSALQILEKRRYPAHVRARWEIIYQIREDLGLSFPQIGRILGGMDHSSVLYGYNEYADLLKRGEVV